MVTHVVSVYADWSLPDYAHHQAIRGKSIRQGMDGGIDAHVRDEFTVTHIEQNGCRHRQLDGNLHAVYIYIHAWLLAMLEGSTMVSG